PMRLAAAGTMVLTLLVSGVGLPPARAVALPAAAPATAAAAVPPPAYPANYDLPNGRFYTQTNGKASPPTSGYAVTDDAGIPMWSELQRLGGVARVGYPVSTRYQDGSFIVQAFQKGILQWRPRQHRAVLLNVMDLLHDAGKDAALQAARQIPPQASTAGDAGKSWTQVVQAHLSLLSFRNAGFKALFNSVPDPLGTFGLPMSPITDEGPDYVIRLQRTAMQLWKANQPWAKANTVTLVNAGDLAKEQGLIPASAARPEAGRMALGEAAALPWSGWWWPSLNTAGSSGPHLFDTNGPLAKYDAYVKSLGQPDPAVRQWELGHFQFKDPRLDWAGKCNGWAVAALVEPEPTQPRTLSGITFTVADQKGLLADYHFADPSAWLIGHKQGGVKAANFHRTLLNWIGKKRKSLVINAFNGANQVASFPVYRFQSIYIPDPLDPNKTHVRTTIWAADYHVGPNFVGLKNWPDSRGKTYTYFIYGSRDNPTGGEWEGDSVAGSYAHPENLWYPDLNPADRNLFGQLTDPRLDDKAIRKITRGA
ncbi:MAG: hypothetical protein ACYDAG_14385, partial [Chloroflexota bacterium]